MRGPSDSAAAASRKVNRSVPSRLPLARVFLEPRGYVTPPLEALPSGTEETTFWGDGDGGTGLRASWGLAGRFVGLPRNQRVPNITFAEY